MVSSEECIDHATRILKDAEETASTGEVAKSGALIVVADKWLSLAGTLRYWMEQDHG